MIQLSLRSSRTLFVVILLIHSESLVAVAVVNLGLLVKIPLIILLGGNFVRTIYKHFHPKSPQSIASITMLNSSDWHLIDNRGRTWPAQLASNSLRTSFIIILNFTVPGRRRWLSVPIFRDSIAADQFRNLSVRLLCLK